MKESFVGDNKSWLICFSGKPIINGVIVKPLDYAKLDNKHYEVIPNDAVVGNLLNYDYKGTTYKTMFLG